MATGRKDWLEGWIALVMLFMLPPLMFGFVQDQLNKVWQNLGMPTPYEKQVFRRGPATTDAAAAAVAAAGAGTRRRRRLQGEHAPPPPGHRPPDAPPPQ